MSEGLAKSLEELLARLHQGDEKAGEAIYRRCEPYLRMVVRRRLTSAMRVRYDSLDIVHSLWVQLVHAFQEGRCRFTSGDHLQAFLIQAARHRLIDHLRRDKNILKFEEPFREGEENEFLEAGPRPSQNAQAEETWEQIQALCSPDQVAVVQLRRQGLTIGEVAAHTGFHPSSVRRILYDIARELGIQRGTSH